MAVVTLTALGAVTFGASGAAGGNSEVFWAKLGKTKAGNGTLHLTPSQRSYPVRLGKRLIKPSQIAKLRKRVLRRTNKSARLRLASHTPVVGETRNWVGLDDVNGAFYRKTYTLRGMGDNIEVWVASEDRTFAGVRSVGTDFQPGDCRNGARTTITDAQVNYLIDEFDDNILPKESAAFSVAPNRNGTNALLGAPFHPGGDGGNTVVLIDNVRDDNFMDLNNTQGFSYIAGFFSSQLNTLFDRNIMTIDAFDWLHRTGASPTHEPSANLCTSAPARPFLYEGVFAHEYQHLLESYASPGEQSWVNEGLSDWAITLTGYGDPAKPVTEIGFDSHTQCFLGNLGIVTDANPIGRNGGPENSLTLWGDQGDDEILCDYGAAYTLMEYLHGLYGTSFMSALHNEDANGLDGLQDTLEAFHAERSAQGTIHDWAMMVAIDGLLDQGRQLRGAPAWRFQTPTLHAAVNWDNPDAFSEPGAPPNGSDYLKLKDAAGNPLKLNDIKSLTFNGASVLPAKPIEWTVDANPPGHAGNPALYSGTGDLLDRAIVRSVTVPAADPNLRFNAQWNTEDAWDFTFVQVSTNGGATYTSVRCTDSRPTPAEDPATYPAVPNIRAHFPGFTGDSAGWKAETCNLSAYTGQTILVSFRNMTDPNTQGNGLPIPPGFWLDDLTLGAQPLSDGSSLTGWMSATQARPIPVEGFTVQLLAYKELGTSPVRIATLHLNGNFDATLNQRQLAALLGEGNNADVVAAIVMYDESTESISDYAPYSLTVN
ncbi:MAG TPA: hypothetical protein VFT18_03405 [Gaiellaceae bacterium]|nr:hypothetical protein [Gaiellaceae bacterium]